MQSSYSQKGKERMSATVIQQKVAQDFREAAGKQLISWTVAWLQAIPISLTEQGSLICPGLTEPLTLRKSCLRSGALC